MNCEKSEMIVWVDVYKRQVQGSGPMYTTIRAFASKYNIPAVKSV